MAKSSAVAYEVRWRLHGSTEAWSSPQRVKVSDEIVVAGLERTKQYDFQCRAISECGAKSAWADSTDTLPDVPAGTITLSDLKSEVDDAADDAAAANAALAAIASDNVLSAGEKPTVIRDYNVIMTEQAGIDAQASAYGITTEKTAYDGKVSALTSYLATLTSPKLWSDLTGDTTIVGSTFRTRFADVYTTRQTLLNAIYAAAKAKADAAQGTADSALANVPYVTNPVFSDGLNGWRVEPGVTGWGAQNALATSPNPAIPTYVSYYLGSAVNTALRNTSCNPCQQGDVISATCQVSCVSGVGTGYVRIIFYDASNSEMSVGGRGNSFTGTASGTSRTTVTAPAGAVYFVIAPAVTGYTTGVFRFTGFAATQLARSQDEVPDSPTYVRAMQQSTSETVDNAGFELPFDANGSCPGWSIFGTGSIALSLATVAPYAGAQSLKITGAIGASDFGVESNRKYACTAGDRVVAKAALFTQSGSLAALQIRWHDGTGATIATNQTAQSSFNVWQPVSITASAPAGAIYYTILLYNPNANGGIFNADAVSVARVRSIDTEVADGAVYGRTSQSDLYVSGGVNRIGLRIAGSGHLIGDQRNLVSSITRNLGITRSATALTANAGGAVDINAHSIQMGGASVSYSAKSNAVTGLATSASYYIYTRDNYAGGSPTWLAGTNQNTVNSYDDAYNAGVVTIPTSGTSGGGSGGGGISGCVSADMYLRRGMTARHLAERWRWWRPCILRGQDGWHFVRRRPRIQPQPCCTITMADGSTLTCSLSTPITVRTGESILAPMVYGHDLFTDSGWQRVIDVELLPGERDVVRISTGGHSFLAGTHPHLRISTHNTIKA